MTKWTPANKRAVERAVAGDQTECSASVWEERAYMLIDPYPCTMNRFGNVETAYVVAKAARRVVYFEDVEEIFGTAREIDGRLVEVADYGPLILALKNAEAGF